MENYLFTKCLHPQKIRNPHTGESLIVSCGKCEACLLQKSSMRSLKCKLESMSHRCTYFVTLTYSNEYIPLMQPVVDNRDYWKYKKTFNFIDMNPRSLTYGCEIAKESYQFHELDILFKKTGFSEMLPYLSKRDAQLFLKRLRKHLSNYSDEKIRYFLCGEYGPVHFRPHFHLLLWFSSAEIEENLSKCISKSWPFGRIDIQKSIGQSASYVAGYLNSNCNLPRVFKSHSTAPFSCHSQFLGEKILKTEKEKVYALPVEQFIRRSLCINGVNTNFSLWRSFKNVYYPRCPQFHSLTHAERVVSYRTYEAASEIFGKISPLQQANKIVSLITRGCSCRLPIIDYFSKKYMITPFQLPESTDYLRKVRQVYMELRCSQHFLNFVSNSNNPYEISTKVLMIEHFYSRCEYLSLCSQFEYEDEFLSSDNSNGDLKFLYWNVWYDESNFYKLKPYRQFRESILNRFRDSIKHKTLNDKNRIFNNF